MGQESILEPVVLGRLGAPYGVKGWVWVHSYTVPIDNLLRYPTWHVERVGPVRVIQGRTQGRGLVVLLAGYPSREEVEALKQCEVSVPRHELPTLEDGMYYWSDLIGLQVVDESQQLLGQVESMMETGSNDVLVVGERLIPFVMGDVILQVDLERRVIQIKRDQVM